MASSRQEPADKNVIVTAADGTRIANITRRFITREFGEILFEPIRGAGDYYVYYLPYKKSGSANYPKDFYPKFEETADPAWLKTASEITDANAVTVEVQSVDAFNSFYPMEVIATRVREPKI